MLATIEPVTAVEDAATGGDFPTVPRKSLTAIGVISALLFYLRIF